jgi:hypothetical protein
VLSVVLVVLVEVVLVEAMEMEPVEPQTQAEVAVALENQETLP